MAEDKEKNQWTTGVSVRVPEWVFDQVEAAISEMPRRERPSRGDLLASAWASYQQKSDPPKEISGNPPIVKTDTSLSGTLSHKIANALHRLEAAGRRPEAEALAALAVAMAQQGATTGVDRVSGKTAGIIKSVKESTAKLREKGVDKSPDGDAGAPPDSKPSAPRRKER